MVGPAPLHSCAIAGTYTATLTVTDANGATNTAGTTVTIFRPISPRLQVPADPTRRQQVHLYNSMAQPRTTLTGRLCSTVGTLVIQRVLQ